MCETKPQTEKTHGIACKIHKNKYKKQNIHKNHDDKYPRQTVSEKQVFIFALYN